MNIKRSSGILLPLFSLPAPYGIGDLGKKAYEFIDFLKSAGQSYWQVLPLGHIGCGASPYQSCSSFAGNPLFIDLEELCALGLLSEDELGSARRPCDGSNVDYGDVTETHMRLLRLACERDTGDISDFERSNPWLSDYALFMALQKHFGGAPLSDWDDDIRRRQPHAVERYTELLSDDILFYKMVQLYFFRQWDRLRSYAHENGVGIIGDLPIYVAADSVDVWREPQWFLLDAKGFPTEVSGVPPDLFSKDGQLWGNPLYDYDAMKADGYGWWIRRIGAASRMFDVLRIDHFRAFESFWAVPADAETAVDGRWVKAPGIELVGTLTSWFSSTQFIAEDLGIITQEVRKLLSDSGLPGMTVLEFAFDPDGGSAYLPHRHVRNSVCYVGTHDNAPIQSWLSEEAPERLRFAREYLGTDDLRSALMRAGMASVSDLFVAQMQDWLHSGTRTNTPGTVGGNWCLRLKSGDLTDSLAAEIYEYTRIYGRLK